jgi:hypothetical protein
VWVPLARLVRDPGLQMRDGLADGLTDPATVERYQETIEDGDVFPPLEAVSDGDVYWLYDGFQRAAALERAGKGSAECLVFPGARADALLRSFAANARHGLTRTPNDCRRALTTLLDAPELLARTLAGAKDHGGVHRALAAACGVSKGLVYKVLEEKNLHAVNGKLAKKRPQAAQTCDEESEQPWSARRASGSTSPVASRNGVESPGASPTGAAPVLEADPSPLADLQRARNAVAGLWTASRQLLDGPLAGHLRRCAAHHKIPFGRANDPAPADAAWWEPLGRIDAVLSDLAAVASTGAESEE